MHAAVGVGDTVELVVVDLLPTVDVDGTVDETTASETQRTCPTDKSQFASSEGL